MKRFALLFVAMVAVSNCFAYGSYSSEPSDWDIFMGFLTILFGILGFILFFKVWGMTNDVRELKNHYVGNFNDFFRSTLRDYVIMGNMDCAKRLLLRKFMRDVTDSYSNLPGNSTEKKQKSIRPYVENLQKQFEKIGEELPAYIKRMETYDDYNNFFVAEDFVINKEEKKD